MQQNTTKPSTLREFDFNYYIFHYTQLLKRWKWYVLIVIPVVTVCFGIYALKFNTMKPKLEAAVMIGLESSGAKSAVADVGESTQQSRLALIKAKGFLSGIVDKLSLRLMVKKYSFYQIFKDITVDSAAPGAKYRLTLEGNNYKVLCWSKELGIKAKLVESGSISSLDTLSLPGVTCVFAPLFLKKPFEAEWFIIRQRDAIAWLLKNLTVYDQNMQTDYGTEPDNFVGVSLKGRDYKMITRIINTIADEFVKKSLGFKKRKTIEAIKVLEKQLQTAAAQVATTQSAVREFRSKHQNVALAAELQGSVSNLALLESGLFAARTSAEDAQRINAQLSTSSEPDQDLLINEALLFLSRQNVVAATVLSSEFTQLLQQKTTLSMGYAKNHPQVIENRSKIASIRAKTQSLLLEYVNLSNTSTYQQVNKINEITSRMKGLPIQQLQLAELERNAQVAAEIHSSVLGRYNQAKISDAVEMPDVFIMDYAIEPESIPGLVDYLRLAGIGLMIILLFAFGPAVLIDLFDKTARSETEVIKDLPFTFLELIPIIGNNSESTHAKKRIKNANKNTSIRLIDPKLVTASYTPDFTNEIFRSLRSKIMLRLHDVDKKRLLITSLGMNEGKSLISSNLAITMAQQKLKTLLIDGDIRRGVQHNTFALQKKPGLSDFLFSEDSVTQETIAPLLQSTHVPNLSIIASGPNVPNPSELLGLPRLEKMIDYLSAAFEIIIIDLPPLGVTVDAAIVSKLFTGAIIILKAGSTNLMVLKKRLKEFPNLQQKITGVVLNQAVLDSSMKKYRYYSYNY